MWRIDLLTDVLMTYKDKILSQHFIIERQENDYDTTIMDKYEPTEDIMKTTKINLPCDTPFISNVATTENFYPFVITTTVMDTSKVGEDVDIGVVNPLVTTKTNPYIPNTSNTIYFGNKTTVENLYYYQFNITVKLNTDFFDKKAEYLKNYDKIVYTGMIDKFFDYKLGELEYRSLHFETEEKNVDNYQGNAVINYTEATIPYTRIIEHKHFEFGKGDEGKTIITREYPADWHRGDEPYYPVNNKRNNELYAKYAELAEKQDKVIFGGRLGQYKYYNNN